MQSKNGIILEVQKGIDIDNTPPDVRGNYSDGYHTFLNINLTMTYPTFERFVEENFKRLNSDLYQSKENKIYFTFEQVEAEYAKMKFKRRKEKLFESK